MTLDLAAAKDLILEGGCEHPWVDPATGSHWIGGYCHTCWDAIHALVTDDDPIWDVE